MDADCNAARPAAFRAPLLVFLVISLLVFAFVLELGMTRGLSHDEHQHVAAGALIARDGLQPYRDFPHFHTPYLPYTYALIFRASDYLLNSARLLSVFCATAILGLLGSVGYGLFRSRGRVIAGSVCAGTVLLAMTTALFSGTSGRAWNHEPSLLLALLAFLAHVKGLRSGGAAWLASSGVLLGLAIGTRITYAPLLAPFGLALLLGPSTCGFQWRRVLAFSGGVLVGLAGLIFAFAMVPEQAFFDNFGFAKTNIAYRFSTGTPRTMTALKKLRFVFKEIVRRDPALFVAGLLPLLIACAVNRGSGLRLRLELRFLLWVLPFLLFGSFAPSPLFNQYFYPLVPFLLLAGLYACASIPADNPWLRRTMLIGSMAILLSVWMGAHAYKDFRDAFRTSYWKGTRIHLRAEEIRSHVSNGRILTFAPIYPLEAGLSIYPSFSTGPIAYRISPYLDAAKAGRLGITSPGTLGSALEAAQPTGVLLGFETGERDFLKYAREHGYRAVVLGDGNELWLK